jgi:putative nucleotidyltransferase with HDIG domain
MANPVKNLTPEESRRHRKMELRSRIEEVIKVSTIPAMMKRIMAVAEDPFASVAELEKLIERDPAIASRVVAVSNAVFYGFSRKINSISQAILVLGFDMVKGLAVSTAVFNIRQPGFALQLAVLWGHSFECAMASVILARKTGLITKESAFLAGLLHDIGKPIMVQTCGARYIESFTDEGFSLEKEEEFFGGNHAEAGAWFADKCKLPQDCVMAIKHHHSPSGCLRETDKPPALVQITYLANIVANGGKPPAADTEFQAVLKVLAITDEEFENIRAEFSGTKDAAASIA